MGKSILKIQNLCVSAGEKKILNGINLKIRSGEIHAIMGPNGSGKSTLANALMGNPRLKITSGKIFINGKNIANLTPDKRAFNGLFLGFQYPKEIYGVAVANFLKTAYNSMLQNSHESPVSLFEFLKLLKGHLKNLSLPRDFLTKDLNVGFSGGEKKKIEILQMLVLEPKFAILDEIDSGLDVDALKAVAREIKNTAKKNCGMILITHYRRILRYIKPKFVHVMINGEIVKSGDVKLARKVEKDGYGWLKK